jgi:hypothetical protein
MMGTWMVHGWIDRPRAKGYAAGRGVAWYIVWCGVRRATRVTCGAVLGAVEGSLCVFSGESWITAKVKAGKQVCAVVAICSCWQVGEDGGRRR